MANPFSTISVSPLPSPTGGFAPNPSAQFNAIQNGASGNSLISQLFTGYKPPVTQSAPVVAASSQVKNTNAPATSPNPTVAQPQPYATSGFNALNTSASGGSILPSSAATAAYAPVSSSPSLSTPTPQPAPTPAPATTPTLGGIIGNLASEATGNGAPNPAVDAAATAQQNIGNEIGTLRQNAAIGEGVYNSAPGTLPIAMGRAQVIAGNEAAAEQGLAEEEQAAQEYTGNVLAGQNQGITGLNEAGALASPSNTNVTPPAGAVTTNTVTGQQYSNPALAGIGTEQFYSPQPNGTQGQPATAGQPTQYTVKSGDTFSALAAANGTTTAAIEAANPGVDPNNLQIGQQVNIPNAQNGQYGTGPAAAANVSSIQDLTTQLNTANQTLAQTQNISSQLTNFISQNQINPSNLNIVNGVVQAVAGQTSNPVYQQFANYVNDLASRYATIITPAGQSTTNLQTQIAQSLLNPTANGGSISTVLNGLLQQAQGVIAGTKSTIQGLQNGGNSAPTAQTNTSTNNSGGAPMFGSFN